VDTHKRSKCTINTLLDELKERFPRFEKNQIFEIVKSVYPDSNIPKEKRNISFDGKVFTKPLAVSRRDKAVFIKEHNKMANFFKNLTRGDFIQVIETDGVTAKCVNLSLKEDVKQKYYNDDASIIMLAFEDVANGTVRPFKRKVDKYIGEY
jgi:hypothetical protein